RPREAPPDGGGATPGRARACPGRRGRRAHRWCLRQSPLEAARPGVSTSLAPTLSRRPSRRGGEADRLPPDEPPALGASIDGDNPAYVSELSARRISARASGTL